MKARERIKLLDYGYVEDVEHWGSDERVIESARMSTAKGFLGWGPKHTEECLNSGPTGRTKITAAFDDCDCEEPGDEKLLKYLWNHDHATPFEMAGLTIEVKAPIMVFREWHRHRIPFGYNEVSARYVPLPNENYHPTLERAMLNSKTNKQAGTMSGAPELTPEGYHAWMEKVVTAYAADQDAYEFGLKVGIPKELARINVPVGRYSAMRATGNLRGWLGFLKLRCAPNAQWEIRQFADVVAGFVLKYFPRTHEVAREKVGMP